jgi:hypothetical protein
MIDEIKPKDEPVVKDLGWAWIGQFSEYPQAKAKWHSEHPKARIKEEIKSMSVSEVDIPDPILFGRTKKATALMIIWAIIYRE